MIEVSYMEDLVKELEAILKSRNEIDRYISALFRAEEAFLKELVEYKRDENNNLDRNNNLIDKISDTLFKNLPLEYRIALKLPWEYTVDIFSNFLKNLGKGTTKDVLINLVETYVNSLNKG